MPRVNVGTRLNALITTTSAIGFKKKAWRRCFVCTVSERTQGYYRLCFNNRGKIGSEHRHSHCRWMPLLSDTRNNVRFEILPARAGDPFTQFCNGKSCKGKNCLFAHTEEEKRKVENLPWRHLNDRKENSNKHKNTTNELNGATNKKSEEITKFSSSSKERSTDIWSWALLLPNNFWD